MLTQLAWWAVILAAFAATLFAPLVIALGGSDPERRLDAADHFLLLHQYFWPAIILVFVVAAGVAIHMSHRIAGPLYRFRRVCELGAAGDLTISARVRESDYLAQESEAFEAMLVSLRTRIGSAQALLADAADRLRQGSPDAGLSAPDLHEVRLLVTRAHEDLLAFRVTSPALAPASAPASDAAAAPASVNAEPASDDRSDHAGFSVLEVLAVFAIIGVLLAISAPRYLAALNSARVARAIGDIKAVDKEVQVQFILKGCYPGTLSDIGRDTLRDPWGRAYIYNVLSQQGGPCPACDNQCISPGQARKDRALVPINSDFDLFSMGKDGRSTSPLAAADSRDDVVRGSNGAFVGLGADY